MIAAVSVDLRNSADFVDEPGGYVFTFHTFVLVGHVCRGIP